MKVAILGATGLVGQRFVQLLNGHSWFELTTLTGSERSVGTQYGKAVNWRMETKLKETFAELTVQPSNPKEVDADIVFSALPADEAVETEKDFAEAGYAVVSNASAQNGSRRTANEPRSKLRSSHAHRRTTTQEEMGRRYSHEP